MIDNITQLDKFNWYHQSIAHETGGYSFNQDIYAVYCTTTDATSGVAVDNFLNSQGEIVGCSFSLSEFTSLRADAYDYVTVPKQRWFICQTSAEANPKAITRAFYSGDTSKQFRIYKTSHHYPYDVPAAEKLTIGPLESLGTNMEKETFYENGEWWGGQGDVINFCDGNRLHGYPEKYDATTAYNCYISEYLGD